MFAILLSLTNSIPISGPGYHTFSIDDQSDLHVPFYLDEVSGYSYYLVYSDLGYILVDNQRIPEKVLKFKSLNETFKYRSKSKDFNVQIGIFLVPDSCEYVDFSINPDLTTQFQFNEYSDMTNSKDYCLNVMSPKSFGASITANDHNRVYYYTNGDQSNIQPVTNTMSTVNNVNLLSVKVTNTDSQGKSVVQFNSLDSSGLPSPVLLYDSAKSGYLAKQSVYVLDMNIFKEGLDPRIKFGSNSIQVDTNYRGYIIPANTVLVFTKFEGIEGSVDCLVYNAPIDGKTGAIYVKSRSTLNITASSITEFHFVLYNVSLGLQAGVVITGNQNVEIIPPKSEYYIYGVFVVTYDGSTSIESNYHEYYSVEGEDVHQPSESFLTYVSDLYTPNISAKISVKTKSKDEASYIIDSNSNRINNSDYIFRFVDYYTYGKLVGPDNIIKISSNSNKKALIIGLVVAFVVIFVIIAVVVIFLKLHKKHHKSSSSSSSSSSSKKAKKYNNSDFVQPTGGYPNQGYPNQGYPPAQGYPPNPGYPQNPGYPPAQDYPPNQQPAPIYNAPLQPGTPYQ